MALNRKTALILCTLLGACDSTRDQLAQVGKQPPFTDMNAPINRPSYKPIKWPEEHSATPMANSLWQPGAQSFFRDYRARRIGDILRVTIEIDDKAELNDKTERKRDTDRNLKVPALFGFEKTVSSKLLPDAANPASLVNIAGASNHSGDGNIRRKEKIQTEVAAMVTQILPNGNLVISGSQEIKVNFEIREVSIEGIVRPQDISPDNSIKSTQIAEARIAYGGRGQITDIQQPPIGSQVLDIVSPF